MPTLALSSVLTRRHLLRAAAALPLTTGSWAQGAACSALLSREFPRLQDEKPQNLCQYAGQVVVVVNTASFCGFTSQYKSLEALHGRYRERGLVVLGFPSNDFGQQEPGSNQDIAAFCDNTFGVRFPMFVKSRVTKTAGPAANPLFADLAGRTGEWPAWNFHKYLIARDGTSVHSIASKVDPASPAFVALVEKLVGAKRD
jgi:glutathione peroxidase